MADLGTFLTGDPNSTPSDGDGLVYDSTLGAYVPGAASGSGILNVSGTVDLDDEPGIREVYATAAATVEGVALAAGDAAVFRYLAGAWTYMVVGTDTTWQAAPGSGGGDPEDTPVTATGPTWTDDAVNGGGTWTTPTETGVTYSPASGTATPGQAVTVTATAQTGYVLTGTASWAHTFPTAPAGDTTPPTVPPNFTANPGPNSVTLTWSPATDDVAVTGYEARVQVSGDPTWTAWETLASGGEITGLTPATPYDAEVRAYDAAGNKGTAATTSFTTTAAALTGDVTDTFTGTDGTLLAGRTTSTGSKTWVQEPAGLNLVGWYQPLILTNGQVWGQADNAGAYIDVNPGPIEVSADYTCSYQRLQMSIGVGVQGGTDPTSVLRVLLRVDTTSAVLDHSDGPTGGTYTPSNLGTYASIPTSGRVTLAWDGTNATVKINGATVIGPVAAPLTATGKVGIGIGQKGAAHLPQWWDNLAVTYL